MRSPAPLAIILALLLSCAGSCPRANSQTKPADKGIVATVSGKVTIKGKPAAGIVVGMRSNQRGDIDPTFKATTDQEGNYRITGLPALSYEVAPVAPAFVVADVDAPRGKILVITEGENVEGIDFELTRGGVITGKVTETDGSPVVAARVNLSPVDQNNQRGSSYPASLDLRTDDRGIYRIFGIRPGNYKVSVGLEGFYVRGRPARPATFYPDVTESAKATVLEVGEGSELSKIDITLAPIVEGFAVNGRVVDENGKPLPNAAIGLSRITTIDAHSSTSSAGVAGTRSDNKGEFRLEKLPPGKYSVSVSPPPESDQLSDPITLDVLDQDVTGLLIKCSNGGSLSGQVVLEGARDNSVVARLSQSSLYVYANIRNDDLHSSSGRTVQVQSDGSFRVGGLQAGTASLSLGGDASRGFAMSRIEREGVAQPNGIPIRTGEHVTGIRIVLVSSTGSIRGVVKVENGMLPAGARFYVQLTKPGSPGGIAGAEVDSRGHFLIEGLTAGSYELWALAYVPGSTKRPPSVKQVVSVTDGAATDVIVTIDLLAIPSP
jgi:protocatechuate 3,4-dioxygenase beta subunit